MPEVATIRGDTLDPRLMNSSVSSLRFAHPYQEDWAGRAAQHRISDAAKDQAPQATPAVRRHSNQVGSAFPCPIDDDLGRETHLLLIGD